MLSFSFTRARFTGARTICTAAALALLLLAASAPGGHAQEAPPEPGTVATGLLLRQLDGEKRVVLVGAHPDDEDTALLAELARGWGADVAYLSLTRGEGGQNLIGPELGEGLGLVRTGELLAARRLDGARQFFTRAYDFGYSKTAEETYRHWPRDSLLADVVWVVRRFRPQVLVSVFSGTPADGHGQHQVAGELARLAFEAAGDPDRFPGQLRRGVEPWAPRKLYLEAWRDPEDASALVHTGRLDPLLGRSHFQVAMESRSQHRSQGFGTSEPPGPRVSRLRLVEDRTGAGGGGLFAGVDTALTSLAAALPEEPRRTFAGAVARYRDAVRRAREVPALDPGAAAPALARAVEEAEAARRAAELAGPTGDEAARVMAERARRSREALLAAAGVSFRLRASDAAWVPGREVTVHATVWNGGERPLRVDTPDLRLPEGWEVRLLPEAAESDGGRFRRYVTPPAGTEETGPVLPAGELREWRFRVRVPAGARPTRLYFLTRERRGALYRWPDAPGLWGLPVDPPLASGTVDVGVRLGPDGDASRGGGGAAGVGGDRDAKGEVAVRAGADVAYRGVNDARGEFWRPVYVVPPLSVETDPELLVWPRGDGAKGTSTSASTPAGRGGGGTAGGRAVGVGVRAHASGPVEGRLRLEAPDGWSVEPASAAFSLEGEGEGATATFRLTPPPGGPGAGYETARVRAVAVDTAGRRYARGLTLVDYPHIDPLPLYREAGVRVERFPVTVADRRVGYVMGSGDDVPEAIRQLGLQVDLLDAAALERGDLDRFDVIVLGVRAYEVRPDLRAANARLLDWVRRGGVLLVQYNKYPFDAGDFTPFPASMARPHDRVTVETAPVELLAPEAPVFTGPNVIGDRDFEGWVQERGLYFFHEWDDSYTPLLAMADPGEDPKRGSLLVAAPGEGLYVYTGLAFFRQLPAGVPGAYRLFANLLSLDPEKWRSWREERGEGDAGAVPSRSRSGSPWAAGRRRSP